MIKNHERAKKKDRGNFMSTTQKPRTIIGAPILLGIMGIIGLVCATIFLLIIWVLDRPWESGNFFTLMGIAIFIFSVLKIKAAYLLWQSKKNGGILGIIICAIGIFPLNFVLVPIYMLLVNIIISIIDIVVIVFIGIFIGIDILTIILIAISWKSLK